jgi:amidase
MPFAPTFDTVGVLARDSRTLASVAETLLGIEVSTAPHVTRVHLISEAFALCEPEARQALREPLDILRRAFGNRVHETSIHDFDGGPAGAGMNSWYESIYRILQWAEIWSSLGTWIREFRPEFGPTTAGNFELARTVKRSDVGPASLLRETACDRLAAFLEPGVLLCIPTTPAPAPFKGTVGNRSQDSTNYYSAALTLTSLAGVGRLPQVSLPLGECHGAPFGLSLLAGHRQDAVVLAAAQLLWETARQAREGVTRP